MTEEGLAEDKGRCMELETVIKRRTLKTSMMGNAEGHQEANFHCRRQRFDPCSGNFDPACLGVWSKQNKYK